MRGRLLAAAVLAAAPLGGCYESGHPDAAAPDAGLDAALAHCAAGAYTRCGGDCPLDCAEGLCLGGLCVPGWGARYCTFRTQTTSGSSDAACREGWACWFDGLDTPAHGQSSHCAPPDACLLAPPDAPPHRCFWSDGTEVTRVPPRGECPEYEDIVWATCGATCGGELSGCGCAGVNDERGFGLCHFGPNSCEPEDPVLIGFCEDSLREPCACMVNEPLAPTTVAAYGFLVPMRACARYAERYPGQVRCARP